MFMVNAMLRRSRSAQRIRSDLGTEAKHDLKRLDEPRALFRRIEGEILFHRASTPQAQGG